MIFITGATGYTGKWVVSELAKHGEAVTCLVRKTSDVQGLDHPAVSLVRGDLEAGGWAGALSGAAAVISVAHIQYAPFVIEACKQQGVSRVVFFSSTWRFSSVQTPVVETVVRAEEAIARSGLDYTILRPTMIYGPGEDRNISRLRAWIRQSPVMPIFGTGRNLVQPVFVEDVAKAAVAALFSKDAIGKGFELAGAEALTYNEMMDAVAHSVGRSVFKLHIPISAGLIMTGLGNRLFSRFPIQKDQVLRMTEDRAFDISSAKDILHFKPLHFEAGLLAALVPGVAVP